jgi:hypothetical protein
MLLRRALIVAGGGFMLSAGLAVVVVIMTLPRWVLTVAEAGDNRRGHRRAYGRHLPKENGRRG